LGLAAGPAKGVENDKGNNMRAYIIRRLLLIIPTFILVTIIVFAVVRLIPGDIVDQMMAEWGRITEGSRAELEAILGLDAPIYVQYGRWMEDIFLHGDLGDSLWQRTPVMDDILARFPVTLELCLLGVIAALIISFPIGVYSAIRQDTWGDYTGRSFAILCIAVPNFWLGTLVVVFPALWWGWSPPIMYTPFIENPLKNLEMFIIPGVILGMMLCGVTMRMMRAMMLEVLRQDYIRTAWSKGLREGTIVMRHALKNALIPVITLVGLQVAPLIGGAVIIEQIFCLPGIGMYLLEGIYSRDYPTVCGAVLFVTVFVLLINLFVDLTYGFLDPRVHYR